MMRLWAKLEHRFAAWTAALCLTTALSMTPDAALAQSDKTRVLWQIDYDTDLSSAQKAEIESVVLPTLARAKERHFAGDKILTQKIKKEGLNFPDCFTEGKPCSAGGAFVLDVHNVDVFAKASFSRQNNEWNVQLSLYQSMSSSPVRISRTGPSLSDLFQTLVGSLFEMESGLELTSTTPDVQIFINEKLVGTTPLTIKTAAGDQSITFKKPGYVSQTWNFTAEKGKIYTKEIDLKPEETQLTILTSADDAIIFIDDEEWGKSNETKNILPGMHKIEVRSETHHTYSQEYRVYPGTPQTMQIAPLPISQNPRDIRHHGISRYRLSTTIGYHFATQKLRMPNAKYRGTTPKLSGDVFFNGISWAFNYESQYWGISFFRFDVGGGSPDFKFSVGDIDDFKTESAVFVGFYPAQLKGHYTFWVMQAEGAFGLGLSHIKLGASDPGKGSFDLKQTAFSLDFSLGLKYFFSEESFAMLTYDMQFDTVKNAKPRHGVTVAFGFQLPYWMRSDDELDELIDDFNDTNEVDEAEYSEATQNTDDSYSNEQTTDELAE